MKPLNFEKAAEGAKLADWSKHTWPDLDAATCARCETVFASHTKFIITPAPMIVSKSPCPKCGCHLLSRSESGWQTETISSTEVGPVKPPDEKS